MTRWSELVGPRLVDREPLPPHVAGDLRRVIREVVSDHMAWYGEPVDAFEINRIVQMRHRNRWAPSTVSGKIHKAGLRVVDLAGVSPSGQNCRRYVVDRKESSVR